MPCSRLRGAQAIDEQGEIEACRLGVPTFFRIGFEGAELVPRRHLGNRRAAGR